MTVFGQYSKYYDLLYQDKDYSSEAEYVSSLIRAHLPNCREVLELGCGTGRHAELLADKGFSVHGVDRSADMLVEAERRRSISGVAKDRLQFSSGDIRDVRVGKKFDAAFSIFHVMSYMTDNGDLNKAFATAKAHLNTGGLFLFDCWYGPAVFEDRPAVRVKRLADEDVEITRIAEPVLHSDKNIVDVNYDVLILDKKTHTLSRISECHRMRYLFLPEICDLFARNGMKPVFFHEWMTGKVPGLDTWSLCAGGVVEHAED
jgi:SAM-dependent methyltransferase